MHGVCLLIQLSLPRAKPSLHPVAPRVLPSSCMLPRILTTQYGSCLPAKGRTGKVPTNVSNVSACRAQEAPAGIGSARRLSPICALPDCPASGSGRYLAERSDKQHAEGVPTVGDAEAAWLAGPPPANCGLTEDLSVA